MTDTIKKFDAKSINASLDEYEKGEGEKIDWSDDAGILYVYAHLNQDECLGGILAFDTVSNVTQGGGQDTTMATCYSGTLGHSFILAWECPTSFKNRKEFMVHLEALHQDAVIALKKINRLLK